MKFNLKKYLNIEFLFFLSLFIIGVLHWLYFYNFGNVNFTAEDWQKEFKYLSILKHSLLSFEIPWHIDQFLQGTKKFLGNPEVILSPQIFLLIFLDIKSFIIINTLIMFSIGFAGILLLKHQLKISMIPFTFLFLLFNFNGYIVSHLFAGHSMWLGYFLIPFYFYLLFKLFLFEKEIISNLKNEVKFSVILSFTIYLVLLQGALHIFIWLIFFLSLVIIFNLRFIKIYLITLAFTFLISAHRIIPANYTYNDASRKFVTGYPDFIVLIEGLTLIKKWYNQIIPKINWWEFDAYIGLSATFFILALISVKIYLKYDDKLFSKLYLPLFIFSIFILGNVYSIFNELSIPFLSVERISSRFIIIPLLFLFIFSSNILSRIIDERKNIYIKLISVVLILISGYELFNHTKLYRLVNLEKFVSGEIIPAQIIFIDEPEYKITVIISYLISLLSILAMIILFLKTKTRLKNQPGIEKFK